jgi:hypothetical protein
MRSFPGYWLDDDESFQASVYADSILSSLCSLLGGRHDHKRLYFSGDDYPCSVFCVVEYMVNRKLSPVPNEIYQQCCFATIFSLGML